MIPKNWIFYRLTEGNPLLGQAPDLWGKLAQRLSTCPFVPCPASQTESAGFVPPFGEEAKGFELALLAGGRALAVCLQVEKRLVSAAALRDEIKEEAKAIEERENRTVGKGERKRIKERLLLKDLQKAQTVKSRVYALVDPKAGWLAVDTSSPAKAEKVCAWLRLALQSFPIQPLAFSVDAGHAMARWLAFPDMLPAGVEIGGLVDLESPGGDVVRSVKFKNFAEDAAAIREALAVPGMSVAALRLIVRDQVSFTLTADCRAKGLDFQAWGSLEHEGSTSDEETFEADTLLAFLEASALLRDLRAWFGVESVTVSTLNQEV